MLRRDDSETVAAVASLASRVNEALVGEKHYVCIGALATLLISSIDDNPTLATSQSVQRVRASLSEVVALIVMEGDKRARTERARRVN